MKCFYKPQKCFYKPQKCFYKPQKCFYKPQKCFYNNTQTLGRVRRKDSLNILLNII